LIVKKCFLFFKANKVFEDNEDNDSIKDYYQQKPKQNLPLFTKHHLNLINEESETSRMSSEQPCPIKNSKIISKEDLDSDDKLNIDDILDGFKKSFREKAMSLEATDQNIRKKVDIEPKKLDIEPEKVELVKLEPLSYIYNFKPIKVEIDEQIVPESHPVPQIDKTEIVEEKQPEPPKVELTREPSPVKSEIVHPVEAKPIAEQPKLEPKQNAVHKRFPILLKKVLPKEPKMKLVVNQVLKQKMEKIEIKNKSPSPEEKIENKAAVEQPKKFPKFTQQRSLDIPKKVDTSFIKKVEPKQVAPVVKPQQQPAAPKPQVQEQKVEPAKKPEKEKPKKRVSTPQFYLEKYIAVYLESLQ
jgi:hypothetical protein